MTAETYTRRRQTADLLNPRRNNRTERCLLKEEKQRHARKTLLQQLTLCFAVVFLCMLAGPMAAVGFAGIPLMGLTTPRLGNYVPGIQGVASSGIGTVNAQVDRRYHSIRILTTNAAGVLTDPTTICSLVELVVNGVVMRTGLPKTFIDIAKTYRYTPATGEIPIFFTEFWRNETPRSAEATSWDLAGQKTFVIRLTFLAPGGGVGVQSILADFDGKRNTRRIRTANGQTQEVAFLAIIKQFDIGNNGASGINDITNIPTNTPIQRLFLDVSANAISKVEVYADNNVKVWEFTKAENAMVLNANDITATFFEYPLIFDYDDRIDSNLKTSYLDVRVTLTGAAIITAHVHTLVPGYV